MPLFSTSWHATSSEASESHVIHLLSIIPTAFSFWEFNPASSITSWTWLTDISVSACCLIKCAWVLRRGGCLTHCSLSSQMHNSHFCSLLGCFWQNSQAETLALSRCKISLTQGSKASLSCGSAGANSTVERRSGSRIGWSLWSENSCFEGFVS